MASAPVLLTRGHTRSALAVARALHRRGVDVLALDAEAGGYARASRAVREVFPAPNAAHDGDAFVAAAADVARRHGVELVIPIADEDLIAIDQQRERFGDTRLAMASSAALRNVLDKRANLALATSLGVPVPRSFDLQHLGQLPMLIEELGWPIVLKRPGHPADPNVPHFGFRVLVAHDVPELLEYLDRWCGHGVYPLMQEFIGGEAFNVVCMATNGELRAIHEYQSVRTFSGNGVLRRVVSAHPDLVEHSRRLLRALRWDGVAHVGFFVDRKSGRVGYMEINGRFWASTQGSIDAGWDFPWWAYRWFTRDEVPQVPPLRVGSQTVWRYGDLQALAARLDGGPSPSPGREPGRLRATLDFLGGYLPPTRSETFRWLDPGPGLIDARSACVHLGRLIRRTVTGRAATPEAIPLPSAQPRPGTVAGSRGIAVSNPQPTAAAAATSPGAPLPAAANRANVT